MNRASTDLMQMKMNHHVLLLNKKLNFQDIKKIGTLYGYNAIIQTSDYPVCLSRMLVSLFEGNISVKLAVA